MVKANKITIASIISFIVLIVGCSVSVEQTNEQNKQLEQQFQSKLQESAVELKGYELINLGENTFWDEVSQTKNPLALTAGQRYNLYFFCSQKVFDHGDYYKRQNNINYDDFGGESWNMFGYVQMYNVLLCMNGYNVYGNKLNLMFSDALTNPNNLAFSEENNVVGFVELFPEAEGYPSKIYEYIGEEEEAGGDEDW